MWNRLKYRPRSWRLFFGLFVLIVVLVHFFVPAQHLPWRPLDPDAPIGLATGTKITLLSLGPRGRCLKKLDQAKSLAHVVAPPIKNSKCGYKIGVTMTAVDNIHFQPKDVTGQCAVALASYIWLNEIDKHAQEYLGSPIAKVHHFGTYSCRRQRGNGSGRWSEHAFANAWDVSGFELKDGRMISVLKDWETKAAKDGDKRQKFLRASRDQACHVFRVVLSPDYNAAHADHFHLDQGPFLSCR